MYFYLVRHGDALSASENPERPLSPAGREAVALVARLARERQVHVSVIYHSGILRAQETAEILAQYLEPTPGVAMTSGLLPDDNPTIGQSQLEAATESMMLVGHLPYMRRLAALLINGDPERNAVDFAPADVLCLSGEHRRWRTNWHLTAMKQS